MRLDVDTFFIGSLEKRRNSLKTGGNKEFAKWFGDWIESIQQNRASVERIPSEKTASLDGQEHSDDAHLVGPKLPVASSRCVG